MTDQERIASAKIVYVVALSGCGKSFTGDYLGVMHGFKHVDGGKCLLQYTLVPFCFLVGGLPGTTFVFLIKFYLFLFSYGILTQRWSS